VKRFCLSICVTLLGSVAAPAAEPSTYFAYAGSPISAKYEAGRLVHLPVANYDGDVDTYRRSEVVSGLLSASRLSAFTPDGSIAPARVESVQRMAYGVPMFAMSTVEHEPRYVDQMTFVWSGATQFHREALQSSGIDARLREELIIRSRRDLEPHLDLSRIEGVGRRLTLSGPVGIRDYGRPRVRPWLVFVDITWHIEGLPDSWKNRGIDSWSEEFRVEYVYDTARRMLVYRNIQNVGGVADHTFFLLKETSGPLLLATSVACSDGADTLLMDLDHETYLPEWGKEAPWDLSCFSG